MGGCAVNVYSTRKRCWTTTGYLRRAPRRKLLPARKAFNSHAWSLTSMQGGYQGLSSFFLSTERRFDIHDPDITYPQECLAVAYRPDIRALLFQLLADGTINQDLFHSLLRNPTALPSDDDILRALRGSTAISIDDAHTAQNLMKHIQRTDDDTIEDNDLPQAEADDIPHHGLQMQRQTRASPPSSITTLSTNSSSTTLSPCSTANTSAAATGSLSPSTTSGSSAALSWAGRELPCNARAFVRMPRAEIPSRHLILTYAHPPLGVHGSSPYAWSTARGSSASALVWTAAAMALPLLPVLSRSTAPFAQALRHLLHALYTRKGKKYPKPILRGFSPDNSRLPRRRGVQLLNSFHDIGIQGSIVPSRQLNVFQQLPQDLFFGNLRQATNFYIVACDSVPDLRTHNILQRIPSEGKTWELVLILDCVNLNYLYRHGHPQDGWWVASSQSRPLPLDGSLENLRHEVARLICRSWNILIYKEVNHLQTREAALQYLARSGGQMAFVCATHESPVGPKPPCQEVHMFSGKLPPRGLLDMSFPTLYEHCLC
ncbi:hypothetical protein FOZ60_016587 [Perkinsus olseni]|uniref:Uncharacterized protein n=1 Tax=Perkinsus olseni TaxID=32597 RepID=A0A7J6N3D2_PEROL|nr:hypothetical protein FOZ60_016587 [Perkinsus olseni]